jgi:hypothetical protein
MKNILIVLLNLIILLSCSKNETNTSSVIKISSCDSIKQGFLKRTSDTIRLLSCITIKGCDSIRLGIVKPTRQDTLRLLSCLNISSDDSARLGLFSIGVNYGGGIIAYFLEPGDPGYDANEKHGLIIATKDELFLDGRWGPFDIIAKTETAIGTGLANTNKIIQAQGGIANRYAAAFARSRRDGGYTDWFLPSKDELNKICQNKTAIGMTIAQTYWSSSEDTNSSSSSAWASNFGSCIQRTWGKHNSQYSVRAVRAF